MASSGIAIGNAYNVIKRGHTDYMLAGGTEAMMVTWGLIFYETSSVLNLKSSDPLTTYLPFSNERNGLALGEGARVCNAGNFGICCKTWRKNLW